LPFQVECPKCGEGVLTARRARRTGNVFYGCGRYPKCDFTTNFEPLGATHDADAGPVALKDESGICLRCGAPVDLPGERSELPGQQLPGGEPNPAALAPSRKRRAAAKGRSSGGARKRKTTKSSSSDDDGS
jgi:ssDNA-binding Zn-finger/Zn-ribbon topoisomerase 1